jgi:hypothetical protein
LVDLGQSACLFEEVIVDIERRFHTYKYGLFIHILQDGPSWKAPVHIPPSGRFEIGLREVLAHKE